MFSTALRHHASRTALLVGQQGGTTVSSSSSSSSVVAGITKKTAVTAAFSTSTNTGGGTMKNVVVVDGTRLPFATTTTIYMDELAVDLQRLAISGLLTKTALPKEAVDYVYEKLSIVVVVIDVCVESLLFSVDLTLRLISSIVFFFFPYASKKSLFTEMGVLTQMATL